MTATNKKPFSFAITTTGTPVPTISKTGTLPTGLRFVAHHNGTASISGTPHVTRLGMYRLTIKATFGTGKTKKIVTQVLKLTVVE